MKLRLASKRCVVGEGILVMWWSQMLVAKNCVSNYGRVVEYGARACVYRGVEVVAEECAGDGHSCYLLVIPDKCQYDHVVVCVVLVVTK